MYKLIFFIASFSILNIFLTATLYPVYGMENSLEISSREDTNFPSPKKIMEASEKPLTNPIRPQWGFFSDFRDIKDPRVYIRKCFPDLNQKQIDTYAKLFANLSSPALLPIEEDNPPPSILDSGKLKLESGFSFPPLIEIQGPFLSHCAWENQKTQKIVLDIGAGHGNDTIMSILTGLKPGKTQTIAVDIHKKQIDELERRVYEIFKQTLPHSQFATLKRDFTNSATKVPEKWVGKFDIVNVNKVFHFLGQEQTQTLVHNIATLLKDNGFLYLTVSTLIPDSTEEGYFKKQLKDGVKNPGLIYWESQEVVRNSIVGVLEPQKKFISQKEAGLTDPGHKIESFKTSSKKDETIITKKQGRHYHTLETISEYLGASFELLDSTVVKYDNHDHFLSLIARKKKNK